MKILSYKMRLIDIKWFASPDTHFFDRKTMKFFASKVYTGYKVDSEIPNDTDGHNKQFVVFITHDKTGFESNQLAFTIRIIKEYHGSVDKVGELGQYATLADARMAAKSMIADGSILS